MKTLAILALLAALLTSCGSSAPEARVVPTAVAIGHGTIVGYTLTSGERETEIELNNQPAGAPGPSRTVAVTHEGDPVDILEERDNGDTLLVRTASGLTGWTQIDFVKRQ